MKKFKSMFVVGVVLITLLSACGTSNEIAGGSQDNEAPPQDNTAQASGNAATSKTTAVPAKGSTASQDGKTKQLNPADLMGEISAVSGNQISLKVIEMPKFEAPKGTPGVKDTPQPGKNGGANGENQPPNDGKQPPEEGSKPDGNGQMPQRTMNYTGETTVITVPANMKITQMSRGQNGMETKEIDVKDLKLGDVLQISYTDKAKGTILKITMGSFMGNPGGPKN